MQEQAIEQQQPSRVFGEETLRELLTSSLREQKPSLVAEIQTMDLALITNDDATSESRSESSSMLLLNLNNCEKLIEQKILAATQSLQQHSRDDQLEPIKDHLQAFQSSVENQQSWCQNKQNYFSGQRGQAFEHIQQEKCQTANQSILNQVQQAKIIYLPQQHNKNQQQPTWSVQQHGLDQIETKILANGEQKLDASECLIEVHQPQVESLEIQNQMNLYQANKSINQFPEAHLLQMQKPAPCPPAEYSICIDIMPTAGEENLQNIEIVIQDEEIPDVVQLNETAAQVGQVAEEFKEQIDQNQQITELQVVVNLEENLSEAHFMPSQENNASLEVNITSESKCNLLQERKDLSFDMQAFQNVYEQLQQQANQLDQNINIEVQANQQDVTQQFMPADKLKFQEINSQQYPYPVVSEVSQENQPVQVTFQDIRPAPDLSSEKQLKQSVNWERIDSEDSEQTYLDNQPQPNNQNSYKFQVQSERQIEIQTNTVYQDVNQLTADVNLENEYFNHKIESQVVMITQNQPLQAMVIEVEKEKELFIIQQLHELVEPKSIAEPENVIEAIIQNQLYNSEQNQAEIVQQMPFLSNNTVTAETFVTSQKISQNHIQIEKDKAPLLEEQIKLAQFSIKPQQKQLCSSSQQTEHQNTIHQNLQKANIFVTKNPDRTSKEVQVDNQASLNSKQQSLFDSSRIPPSIKINITRDNQISLSIFNTNAANSYNQHQMNQTQRFQENARSVGQRKIYDASAEQLRKQAYVREKGTQAAIDTKSVFTEMQQSQKLDFSQSVEKEQIPQDISHRKQAQYLHQISSMADNYLMSKVIEQTFHKKFEEMLRPHIALKMSPEPTTEIGRQIFKNGLILVAIVKMIARSSKSPFLQNYIFQYIQSTFTIESNSYVFKMESNQAKERYHSYLEEQYQQNYNQMRAKSEKEVKRASLGEQTYKKDLNSLQGNRLQLHSNSFSVNQQISGKNQKVVLKQYFHQQTQTSARFQNTRAQNIKNQKPHTISKVKQQPKKLQEQFVEQPKQANVSKPAPKNNDKSCLPVQTHLEVDSKKQNKQLSRTFESNIAKQKQDKVSKMESLTKPKMLDQKLTSQKKSEFMSQLQTSSQTKSPLFDELFEKYKKIRENKKQNPKPLDEANQSVLKSVLIESKQKQAGAEKKKRHVQFAEEIAELRRQEPDFSQEEEAKLKKRKRSRKSEISVEQQDETSKAKKNGSRK